MSLPFLQESCCFAVVSDRTATTPEQLQELLETLIPESDLASPFDRLHSFDHIHSGAAGSTLKGGQAARWGHSHCSVRAVQHSASPVGSPARFLEVPSALAAQFHPEQAVDQHSLDS